MMLPCPRPSSMAVKAHSPSSRRCGGHRLALQACNQANIRREEGGGGGSGAQQFCVPKMSRSDIPYCKFRFFPKMVTLVWGRGGVLLWLSAVLT